MLMPRHLAIIGGGFTGTLLAVNLLRHGTLKVTLIEQRPERLGKGLAFGGAGAGHVLNVRASNMSAFPDQPGHFADWLQRHDLGTDSSFATRAHYGAYLSALLDDARNAAHDQVTILEDQAVDLALTGSGCAITLGSGARLGVDMVALAPGNLPPHDLPAFQTLSPPHYIGNPWSSEMAQGLNDADSVLLLGSGLTAVDCAQTLDSAGFRGAIYTISRRGLIPHRHAPSLPFPSRGEKPASMCTALVQSVRRRAKDIGWRNAVDELRPFTQDIWRSADASARARFLRHLRPYWDVHRHRIAPEVAGRLDRMIAERRLHILAGKIGSATVGEAGIDVGWRRRGHTQMQSLHVTRVVNCTGPLSDLARTTDPLLRKLADAGTIRPDSLAIGIDVDRDGRAVARDGSLQERLIVAGPMTRGAHWEIVAVPDIRRQTWALARAITGAHWVEAEGL